MNGKTFGLKTKAKSNEISYKCDNTNGKNHFV